MHNKRNMSLKSASADAEMSSTDFHSDDNLDSLVSQSRLLQRIESLDDILDRHEAIFGTEQSPGEAPSPTFQPTEPSETLLGMHRKLSKPSRFSGTRELG